MEILQFEDLQKDIENTGLKNPKVIFNYPSVKFISIPYLNDILGQLFLGGTTAIFFFDIAYIFVSFLFFCAFCYFFYFHFIGVNVCKVDFLNKNIVIRNRIFILNLLRKLFGSKTRINFADVKEISCKEGMILDRFSPGYASRYTILVETYSHAPIIMSQFKNEEEAKKVVTLLTKILLLKKNNISF